MSFCCIRLFIGIDRQENWRFYPFNNFYRRFKMRFLGLLAVGVFVYLCHLSRQKECWNCGKMVSPDSDGDYICSCGRWWR